MDYLPFGEIRKQENLGEYENKYKFTGKERDVESGLDYFEARYYDSVSWRFRSIDRVFWEVWATKRWLLFLADPQQLNAYLYSRNNPIIFNDPNWENCASAVWMTSAVCWLWDFAGIKNAWEWLWAVTAYWVWYATWDIYMQQSATKGLYEAKDSLIAEYWGVENFIKNKTRKVSKAYEGTKKVYNKSRKKVKDLQEKLALDEAKSNPLNYDKDLTDRMTRNKDYCDDLKKYWQSHKHPDGSVTEIHYDYNVQTNETSKFKLKQWTDNYKARYQSNN